jgi:serine/threonine protein phosphatase PrpC
VGDSRIYLSRDGELTQLSRDHTLAWDQWKRGQIGEMQYRSHPRRSALYEVMGGGHPRMRPHLAAIPYLTGDRFLICSDGLIDGLTEQHICKALAEDLTPTAALEKMLERALRGAGTDDTTLIVIHL